MADTPQQPKRKRWRWLLLALLLIPIAAVGWWFYPRGDSRFVGNWKSNRSSVEYWSLHANGLAVFHTGSPGSPSAWTTWQVRDNIFQFGQPQNTPHQKRRAWLLQQWNNFPFNKWIVDSTSFRVLKIDDDKLVLRSADFLDQDDSDLSSDTETLTRMRE